MAENTMNRGFLVVTCAAFMVIGAGCYKRSSRVSEYMAGFTPPPAPVAEASERYIAERHKLNVITSESDLQKSWEATVAYCATIQCELVSSSITTRTAESLPTGMISLRVAPADLTKLLGSVEKLGRVVQHTTEREDKTTQVVDTEAKIKNLTAFRDSLRTMLAKQSATVRDVVEIQKQLTDTQSQLDSETAQRKILANETEKVAVEISFRVEWHGTSAGGQIWNALRESGSILADSTASLITTVVAIIPWLILVVPLTWLLRKAWKKWKRSRSGVSTPPSVAGVT